MLDVISFLTKIPVRREIKIEKIADKSYLFPLVGLIIGFLVSCVAFVSFRFLVRNEIAALLTLLSIYLLTGLIHLDGLADFFDGIMASGDKKEKIRAMKYEKIGISGVFSSIFIILLNLFCVRSICASIFADATIFDLAAFFELACVFIISEVSAKISMNTCMFVGKGFKEGTGAGTGMGALFINSFSKSKYVLALLFSILISLIATSHFFLVLTGIIVGIFVSYVAKNNFGAVNGDVMGASNEIARCVTLLVWAICGAF